MTSSSMLIRGYVIFVVAGLRLQVGSGNLNKPFGKGSSPLEDGYFVGNACLGGGGFKISIEIFVILGIWIIIA
jgi:hypothetical protein